MPQHSARRLVTLTANAAAALLVVVVVDFVTCVFIVLDTAAAAANAKLRFIVGLLRLLIVARRFEWVTVAVVVFVVTPVDDVDFHSTHCG